MGNNPSSETGTKALPQAQIAPEFQQAQNQAHESESARALMSLRLFIAKQGKDLPPGWEVSTKRRNGSNRVDYHFLSPEGQHFRSKFDVARHLGIQVQRRPGGRDVHDLDMADADVAAVLMSMPHDNGSADLPHRGKEEVAASPTAEGGDAVTPQAKEPGHADALSPSGHSLPTGLAAIADAAEHASPFSSELKGGAHHSWSYDEHMSAELQRLQAKQLKRLHQAAEAAEVDLGPGWTAEVKVRQQGTTAGSTDTYYRSSNGKRFRSIKAALEHVGKSVLRESPWKDAASEPIPEKHGSQKSPSPIRHRTSKLIIKGSMLRADTGSGQAIVTDKAPEQTCTHEEAQAEKQAEDAPEGSGHATPIVQPAKQSQSTAGPTNPGKHFGSMSALLAPAVSSTPGIKPAAAPETSRENANPKASAPGQPVTSSSRHGSRLHPSRAAQTLRGEVNSMDVKQDPAGAIVMGSIGVQEQGCAATQPAEAAAAAQAAAEACTGEAAEEKQQPYSLAGKAAPGTSRRKRGSLAMHGRPGSPGCSEKGGVSPKSPRRKRTAKMGRVDYATMEALADLNYAMNREAQNGRGKRKGKGAVPEGQAQATNGQGSSAPNKPGSGTHSEPAAPKRDRPPRLKTAYTRLVNRARTLVSRIGVEQAYIDAYEGEGWKGANREKLKPDGDLKQAHLRIEKCKLGIREAVKECEISSGDRQILARHFDEDGEIDQKWIFCAKCADAESHEENDIILCDGNCRRAYHEKCLEPPLNAAGLPEDEGWLCPGCDAKAEILTLLNDEYGFEYEQETPWHAVFAEAPQTPRHPDAVAQASPVQHKSLADFLATADLADSDSSDCSFREEQSNEEGDAAGSREHSEASTTDSLSSEAEGPESGEEPQERPRERQRVLRSSQNCEHGAPDLPKREALLSSGVQSDGSDEGPVEVLGKRKRSKVDYRKLDAEMFGDVESYEEEVAEDEDFSPRTEARARGES